MFSVIKEFTFFKINHSNNLRNSRGRGRTRGTRERRPFPRDPSRVKSSGDPRESVDPRPRPTLNPNRGKQKKKKEKTERSG